MLKSVILASTMLFVLTEILVAQNKIPVEFYKDGSCSGDAYSPTQIYRSPSEKTMRLDRYPFSKERSGNTQHPNDKFRSVKLKKGLKKGSWIELYDDLHCETNDDWTVIHIRRDVLADHCYRSFESKQLTAYFLAKPYHRDGLNGKVSCIRWYLIY